MKITPSIRHTFRDRHDAGRAAARALQHYRVMPPPLVLGLARGGVPVAWEVAAALGAPLDVFVVRKLGAPQSRELAIGALASGGIVVLNDDLIVRLQVSAVQLREEVHRESAELDRREVAYRSGRPPLNPRGRTVILVDDGVATGASVTAAFRAVRASGAARVVVAVPVGPPSAIAALSAFADEVVCVMQPPTFSAVGQVYADFTQVSDVEVQRLLAAGTER